MARAAWRLGEWIEPAWAVPTTYSNATRWPNNMHCADCPSSARTPDFHQQLGLLNWGDKCGVYGVYAPGSDVARLAYFGLYALQHRGQESAGIAVGRNGKISCHVGMGLASQVFDEEIIAALKGDVVLGHVRYSTTGSSSAATLSNTNSPTGRVLSMVASARRLSPGAPASTR